MKVSSLDLARDREGLVQVLAHRPRWSYDAYADLVAPQALREFSLRRDLQLLGNGAGCAIAARNGDTLCGLASWCPLPWDSAQFGFPAGRLDLLVAPGGYTRAREVKRALLESLFSSCRERGISHLTARVDAGDLSSIHALESAGCELIDGIQTFSLRLQNAGDRTTTDRLEVRMFREDDLPQVLAIARTSYVYDRFHADSALSPEVADAANEDWVRNSCAGTAADSVIVACREAQVLSYVICKIDRETGPALGVSFGTIVLVATAREARGRGAARAATQGALGWFRAEGVDVVEVGTQIRNISAGRLYETCGFRLVGVSLTFRRLL